MVASQEEEMPDEADLLIQLTARTTALEIALKGAIAMLLVTMAKSPDRLAKTAQMAHDVSQRLQDQADQMVFAAVRTVPGSLTPKDQQEIRNTIARCFDQPAEELERVAAAYLEMMESPSGAKH